MLMARGLEQQLSRIFGTHLGNLAGLRSVDVSIAIVARDQDITVSAGG